MTDSAPSALHRAIELVEEHGSIRAAARESGIPYATLHGRVKSALNKGVADRGLYARRGLSPQNDMGILLPPGFRSRGTSTLRRYVDGEPGNVVLQWEKSATDRDQDRAVMEAAMRAFSAQLPRAEPQPAPLVDDDDLMVLYPLADAHFGMLAWAPETGADYNLKIAERIHTRWFEQAIACTPPAKVAVLAQLGDLLHQDGLQALTPTSGHMLDADSRFPKMLEVVYRLIRRIISMLLAKHERVHIINLEGNHDLASSAHMRVFLQAYYENEPRVTVEGGSRAYQCYEFGKVALFFHHGHLKKPSNIDAVFTAMFREVYGRTKFAFAHMGHLHHEDRKRTTLMVVEQHGTLAGPDSYAARYGFISDRSATAIVYHRECGEVVRFPINPALIALMESKANE